MSLVADKIFTSYLNNIEKLNLDQQFHFFSRLYLWYKHPFFLEKLKQLQPQYLGENPEDQHQLITRVLNDQKEYDYNCFELRQPALGLIPDITKIDRALFKCLFGDTIFDTDLSQALIKQVPLKKLKNIKATLLKDDQSFRLLSTIAINFLYLFENTINKQDTSYIVKKALKNLEKYDLSNPCHIILAIYLLTHCIIGESKYYKISPVKGLLYKQALSDIHEIIVSHYFELHLDVKLEYLVCCHLCNEESSIKGVILNEAKNSLTTQNGRSYLIDRFSLNPQKHRTTFETSEHRNVLYLLAVNNDHFIKQNV
jgi:hypothetical protein